MDQKAANADEIRQKERVRDIKNWLQLSFLGDRVNTELRKLLCSKLEKLTGREWDGSSESVSLLKKALGKRALRSTPRSLRERIDSGDVVTWDLQAVSYVLRSLSQEWVSLDEKRQTEVVVEVRNFLAHHPNRIVSEAEFSENWEALISILKFLNAPTDLIQKEIKAQTADIASLYSPSVTNPAAKKLKEEGNDAFKNDNYDQAVEKYSEAMKIITLRDAERGVFFSNRAASFLQLAKTASDDKSRNHYARLAETDAKMAVQLQPLWTKALFRLGEAYQVLEKYDKALEAYNEALTLKPSCEAIQTRRDECSASLARRQASDHLPPAKTGLPHIAERISSRGNGQKRKETVTRQGMESTIGNFQIIGEEDVRKGINYRDGLETTVNYELAARHFSKAAAKGNAQATYELALLTQTGKSVRKDQKLALQLYEQAAAMAPNSHVGPNVGVRESMHALGFLYWEGVCVSKSDEKAFEWYKRAADLGYGPSANNLGNMCSKGEGGVSDSEKAVQYWKLAARQKCFRAMKSLAFHFCKQRDIKNARAWMQLAIKEGEVLTKAEQEEFEESCVQEEEELSEESEQPPIKQDKEIEDSTKDDNKRQEMPNTLDPAQLQTMEHRVREIKNWLQLSFLCDRVNELLQKSLLTKLEKICGCEWDGSIECVTLLKQTIGEKELKFAVRAVTERIDNGDIFNWDLTSVSFVLRSLGQEWVSLDEKQQMDATVKIRNFLHHHQSRVVSDNEFFDKRDVLVGVLKFFKAPVDSILEEIRTQTADAAALYSPSVLNQEAKKIKEEGNQAFRDGNYHKAVEKYEEATRIVTLKDSERGVLFSNRSASFLLLAKMAQGDEERQRYAKRAEADAKRAVHLHPLWPIAHQRLGDAYQAREKYEKAEQVYNEALGLYPGSEVIKVRRDNCRIKHGRRKRNDHLDPMNMLPTSREEMLEKFNSGPGVQFPTAESVDNFFVKLAKTGDCLGKSDVHLGLTHLLGQGTPVNYKLAAKHFSAAAAKGNAQATYELARLVRDGKGVRQDHKRAFDLLEKAAAMPPDFLTYRNIGVREAMHVIGLAYYEGVYVEKSDIKAFEWYKRAADLGFGSSANNLAHMYKNGEGGILRADREKAVEYWKVAARDKNTRAMISLAENCLLNGDVKQARDWLKHAIEGGDVEALAMQPNFEEACRQVEEQTRPLKAALASELGWPVRETDSLQDLKQAYQAKKPEIFDVMNELDSISRKAAAASPYSSRHSSTYDPAVVAQYAAQGRVYARQVWKALKHHHAAMAHLMSYKVSHSQFVADAVLSELGQCVEIAGYVALFPEEDKSLLKELAKQRMDMYINTPCQMDIYARECYSYLIMGSHQENVAFLKSCIAKYPEVLLFYDQLASMYGFLKMYQQGVEVAEKALAIFPDRHEVLYTKAALARLAYDETDRSPDQEIEYYKKFLQHAPADHRKVPEAYYCIALLIRCRKKFNPHQHTRDSEEEEYKVYFEMGLESEKLLLPCFLPYNSTTKDLLISFARMAQYSKRKPLQQRSSSIDAITPEHDNLPKTRLTDPCRITAILNFRKVQEHVFSIQKLPSHYSETLPIKPQFKQAAAPSPAGLKPITLGEMNDAIDKVYQNCVLDVQLIEDPTMTMPSVHVLLEDKKGKVLRGYFYNVKGESRLKYGAKVKIANPYLRIARDGFPGIRVDEPKNLFFYDEHGTNRCRYCGGNNSKFQCVKCTRKYCSRECQTHDWKILKHKLICGLPF